MEVTVVPAALRTCQSIKYLDSAFLVVALWVQLQSRFLKFGLASRGRKFPSVEKQGIDGELGGQKESWLEGECTLV